MQARNEAVNTEFPYFTYLFWGLGESCLTRTKQLLLERNIFPFPLAPKYFGRDSFPLALFRACELSCQGHPARWGHAVPT